MNKYHHSIIYSINCNLTNEIYIGSTTLSLRERIRLHKKDLDCSSK